MTASHYRPTPAVPGVVPLPEEHVRALLCLSAGVPWLALEPPTPSPYAGTAAAATAEMQPGSSQQKQQQHLTAARYAFPQHGGNAVTHAISSEASPSLSSSVYSAAPPSTLSHEESANTAWYEGCLDALAERVHRASAVPTIRIVFFPSHAHDAAGASPRVASKSAGSGATSYAVNSSDGGGSTPPPATRRVFVNDALLELFGLPADRLISGAAVQVTVLAAAAAAARGDDTVSVGKGWGVGGGDHSSWDPSTSRDAGGAVSSTGSGSGSGSGAGSIPVDLAISPHAHAPHYSNGNITDASASLTPLSSSSTLASGGGRSVALQWGPSVLARCMTPRIGEGGGGRLRQHAQLGLFVRTVEAAVGGASTDSGAAENGDISIGGGDSGASTNVSSVVAALPSSATAVDGATCSTVGGRGVTGQLFDALEVTRQDYWPWGGEGTRSRVCHAYDERAWWV